MTRFARAKGSKSSNERVPEDATSWSDMKKQIVEKEDQAVHDTKRKEAEAVRLKNYQNFLKEEAEKKTGGAWCDFPNTAKTKPNTKTKVDKKPKNGKIAKKNKPSKKPMKKNYVSLLVPPQNECDGSGEEEDKTSGMAVKKNYVSILPQCDNKTGDDSDDAPDEISVAKTDTAAPKKKQNLQNTLNNKSKKQITSEGKSNGKPKNTQNDLTYNKKGHPIKKKVAKTRDDQEHKSRKPNGACQTIFVNGKNIEVMKYEGFPIKKEDYERLTELKKSMIAKGIPKSEVKVTMMKERRRAEKAFAREKKKVCFQCRKSGHVLSECPEVGVDGMGVQTSGTGMCFKCGSTEHSYLECKVVRSQEFKFAECFICKEKGHIARQCPDNPRGLYPKGGGCRLCGEVTHLKRFCPKVQQENEEKAITLPMNGSSVEGLENDVRPVAVKSESTCQNVVKF